MLDLPNGVFLMLVFAGMDAQHMEAKLSREAKEAWEAYLAEKDPARSDKLEKRWNEAKGELNSFRRQQVAGGEGPQQGCKVGPACRAAAEGAPCERCCSGPGHQGWRRP